MAAGEVFWTFRRLGCTLFGGPTAHLGFFRTAFVQRLGWLPEARYAELVALGQFLPGPASSQVGFAIGLERAGPVGSAAAFFLAERSAATAGGAREAVGKPDAWPFVLIGLAVALLLLLPVAARFGVPGAAVAEPFYRAGALVFGGGHVVLPFLESATVGSDWLSAEQFLAGYGIAQAIPGPLFTFATYVGTVSHGLVGGMVALVAIFLPGMLLMAGVLPLWTRLSGRAGLRRALGGLNAGVVGILAAALYDPLWTSSVGGPMDVAAVAIGWAMLQVLKLPSWTVALSGLAYGLVLTMAG